MITKPPFGSPCNGCGYCCQQQACGLSVKYLASTAAPCIALESEDDRFYCGLVRHPGKYLPKTSTLTEVTGRDLDELSVIFAYMLGLGAGCDATDTP